MMIRVCEEKKFVLTCLPDMKQECLSLHSNIHLLTGHVEVFMHIV
jgi:hypothetical protein